MCTCPRLGCRWENPRNDDLMICFPSGPQCSGRRGRGSEPCGASASGGATSSPLFVTCCGETPSSLRRPMPSVWSSRKRSEVLLWFILHCMIWCYDKAVWPYRCFVCPRRSSSSLCCWRTLSTPRCLLTCCPRRQLKKRRSDTSPAPLWPWRCRIRRMVPPITGH